LCTQGLVSSVRGTKSHGDYCGLFTLLSRISKQGSDDDDEFLASFTQQFSGTSGIVYAYNICDNSTHYITYVLCNVCYRLLQFLIDSAFYRPLNGKMSISFQAK